MKAIVIAQALLPWSGGSAISEASLCASLAKRCDVTVLCRKGAIDFAFARTHGVNEIVQYQPRETLQAWRDPNHWLNRTLGEGDVLHLNGHWRWEHLFLAKLCERHQKPFVLQPRGMLLLGHRRKFLKRLFNLSLGNRVIDRAVRLIALSRFEVEQFQPYGVEGDRIVVIPNGISAPAELPAETTFKPPQGETPFFLYLGRLESRKNLLFLVEVFSRYVHDAGKAVLYLVGPVERGYDQDLRAKISECGMERHVSILPPVYHPDKWLYLKKARAVIYPTLDEPFGRVPFEALAAGTFPIVPDESGSAEYLQPLLPKCVYRIQDPDSLLAAMKSVENEPDGDALAKARAWVSEELNWNRIAQLVHELYQEVVESKSGHEHRIEEPESISAAAS